MATGKYDDIIHLPHHTSTVHPRMSPMSRAAQFAPFAALSGHDAALQETARLTDPRRELDEQEKSLLDGTLRWIGDHLDLTPAVEILFFEPDAATSGGTYETIRGCVRAIDLHRRVLRLTDGNWIPIDDIRNLTLLPTTDD